MELTLAAPPETAAPPLDLDPELLPGEAGYFAGEWLAYDYDGGQRYEGAYAGMLIDRWHGWAVWECTRDVATAVVVDQEMHRRHYRQLMTVAGHEEPRLTQLVDGPVPPMSWSGDAIVVDLSATGEGIVRIEPNERGRYVVMGGRWCWEEIPVDLADFVYGQLD
ncbi:hypothetical protein V6U90_15885 [Micromonospora sp. CPCC 206060]|uniref:hypothetical protein n=1 Tax=Micromonospora sp. CPCC 206060 TaxID=3122406 RepID=UPI002FF05504